MEDHSPAAAAERLLLVSIDAHVSPKIEAYRPYCEQRYRDDFEEFVRATRANPGLAPDEGIEVTSRTRSYLERLETEYGNEDVNADPATRIRDMDADGVAAEVIFHGAFARDPIPFFGHLGTTFSQDVPDSPTGRTLRAVGITTYNRWLADWCSTAPGRLLGMAHIPMWDVSATVDEIRRAHAAGIRCVNLPSPRRDLVAYNDPEWNKVWAVCSELGISLHTHGGGGESYPAVGLGANGIRAVEVSFAGRRGIWQLICGGVFERYPDLRFFVTEQNGTWVADLLRTLDSAYLSPMQNRAAPWLADTLPELPSTYFRQNCLVGASFMSRFEATEAIANDYWRSMTWGRDYPHSEGTWPYTAQALAATFAALPSAPVRAMLGETAVKALGLDEAAMRAEAARIGPPTTLLDHTLGSVPAGAELSMAFRSVGQFA